MIKLILNWIKKNAALLGGGIFVFLMIVCFVSGCNYQKKRFRCPEITTHTVIIHDTLIHKIVDSFPYYIVRNHIIVERDTVIREVDTAAILKDYFAYHVYDRHWQDSLLSVDLRDTVTENRFLRNDFSYKILRPQKIINVTQDNSVHYSKYVYLGIDLPVKNMDFVSIDVLVATNKYYLGFGYEPFIKSINFKTGIKLIKFKN